MTARRTAGTLYVVATPLGNPADVSRRAIETLRGLEVIFAEDTRTTHRLLSQNGITPPNILSCFDGNETSRAAEAVALLERGTSVGLLAEAGTPTISDPGYRIVQAAVAAGARVVPIPGPAAFLAALVASGLPTARFSFLGFPPRKAGPRRALLASLAHAPETLIFYESPHRAPATLADLAATLGANRQACVARELTKTHEDFVRGTLADLATRYRSARPLGEITLVVAGAQALGANTLAAGDEPGDDDALGTRARALLAEGKSARDVADELSGATGQPRRAIYKLVVTLASTQKPPSRGE
jgi:16S rRNA (cytidine1402-2'-O)-methyltransferase